MALILCNTQRDEQCTGANFPPVHMHILLSGFTYVSANHMASLTGRNVDHTCGLQVLIFCRNVDHTYELQVLIFCRNVDHTYGLHVLIFCSNADHTYGLQVLIFC
jgi:superfamily II DNA or RNA helicase